MILVNDNPAFEYALRNVMLLFFPGDKIMAVKHLPKQQEKALVVKASVKEEKGNILLEIAFFDGEKNLQKQEICKDNEKTKTQLARLCFTLLCEYTGLRPLWGTLTGIRPVKLFLGLLQEGMSTKEARSYLKEIFLVSEEKLNLLEVTAKTQRPILKEVGERDCSLYISIPFCPTRCSYCSFVSAPLKETRNLVEPHLCCLLKELELTRDKIKETGFTLKSIYIGGGTPTTLKAEQLKLLFEKLKELFDIPALREFTLEAGRPDTIDEEKLRLMKTYGITRLNINPQTFNDKVLEAIGREHTAEDIERSFHLARSLGFTNINMDLIAGLEADTLSSFQSTIQRVLALGPENITVHTLYMKRTSRQVQNKEARFKAEDKTVQKMVNYARETLKEEGYQPFYLYRQRNTVNNLENVGYSKAGFESPYNIWIMDESHTIFGCGAGAVSKLVKDRGKKIERIFNFKLPHDYINSFEEECKKKAIVHRFYSKENCETQGICRA